VVVQVALSKSLLNPWLVMAQYLLMEDVARIAEAVVALEVVSS
jgi:hypothetical protein